MKSCHSSSRSRPAKPYWLAAQRSVCLSTVNSSAAKAPSSVTMTNKRQRTHGKNKRPKIFFFGPPEHISSCLIVPFVGATWLPLDQQGWVKTDKSGSKQRTGLRKVCKTIPCKHQHVTKTVCSYKTSRDRSASIICGKWTRKLGMRRSGVSRPPQQALITKFFSQSSIPTSVKFFYSFTDATLRQRFFYMVLFSNSITSGYFYLYKKWMQCGILFA